MTPDLHAAFLTAGNNLQPIGDWLLDFWITFGPGLALAAGGWAVLWAWNATAPWFTRRYTARRGIRRLEHFANHPAHRRDQPRKETDQP